MTNAVQTIAEAERQIVEDFQVFDDWSDRYRYIIEVGKKMSPLAPDQRVDENKVEGCQSQVWLACTRDGDRLSFAAESDAFIVQGLIALAIKTYSGHTPNEILAASPDFIANIGLSEKLSPIRSGGLNAVVNKIRRYAQYYQHYAKD